MPGYSLNGMAGQANASATQRSTVIKTFTQNAGTYYIPIFRVIGLVRVIRIWAVVTTQIGVNHTAAYWRLNDATATVFITAVGGPALSGYEAGSCLLKMGLAAAAATAVRSNVGVVGEPTSAGLLMSSEFMALKKVAATTEIEYSFATTDNPTSGALQFFAEWQPLSADGNLYPV